MYLFDKNNWPKKSGARDGTAFNDLATPHVSTIPNSLRDKLPTLLEKREELLLAREFVLNLGTLIGRNANSVLLCDHGRISASALASLRPVCGALAETLTSALQQMRNFLPLNLLEFGASAADLTTPETSSPKGSMQAAQTLKALDKTKEAVEFLRDFYRADISYWQKAEVQLSAQEIGADVLHTSDQRLRTVEDVLSQLAEMRDVLDQAVKPPTLRMPSKNPQR